ncbi:ATP-binding cassette domain-containing protein [Geodermatophilus sp. SYSU D01180]
MRYREHTALDGVTTGFATDGITGLLGRNGAGKTTLMQLLTGHRVHPRQRAGSGRRPVRGRRRPAAGLLREESQRATRTPSGCATP